MAHKNPVPIIHPAHKNPVPIIPRGSLPEQVDEEDPNGNWLTQVHLEKRPRVNGVLQAHLEMAVEPCIYVILSLHAYAG